AGRAGVSLSLDDFDRAGRSVPVIVDVAPSGSGVIQDLHRAGGLPAVLAVISEHLDRSARTVTDRSIGQIADDGPSPSGVVRGLAAPVLLGPGLAVLRGSLAPRGAVIKVAAASPALLRHQGPAIVFEGYHDMRARIADPDLAVTPQSVLVLRGCGPVGGPGMPEWGMIPIPPKLAAAGVTDMVRITD